MSANVVVIQVVLGGPGLDVALVATRDIAPGEGLVLCDGGGDDSDDGSDSEADDSGSDADGAGEEEEAGDGPPTKRRRRGQQCS